MARTYRPYRRTGSWFFWIGVTLVVASFPQLFFGIPLSEGFAPAGLSLGPIACIGGVVLFYSQKPLKGEKWKDDGFAIRSMDNLQ